MGVRPHAGIAYPHNQRIAAPGDREPCLLFFIEKLWDPSFMHAGKSISLMNDKEKNYVSYCFSRIANLKGVSIDYERVLNREKINYDLQNSKKEIKQTFGKLNRRSKKWLRLSANTETDFLNRRLVLCSLFEINSIMKCISLDDENKADMEEASFAYFAASMKEIIDCEKTFVFLSEFFDLCSAARQSEILALLVSNCDIIREGAAFSAFLSHATSRIKTVPDLPLGHLWGSSGGYAIATCLLERSEAVHGVLESFLDSRFTVHDGFHPFVEKLSSKAGSEDDHLKIKNKVAHVVGGKMLQNLTI